MTNNYKKSLIIYELNEIPKKVLENFVYKNPKSNLAKLYNNNGFSETFTNDSGELHPWSSWPTFHRGVNSQIHNIKFLNQDFIDAKKFPTIWEKLNLQGFSIGIFGSLQSFPPFSLLQQLPQSAYFSFSLTHNNLLLFLYNFLEIGEFV